MLPHGSIFYLILTRSLSSKLPKVLCVQSADTTYRLAVIFFDNQTP